MSHSGSSRGSLRRHRSVKRGGMSPKRRIRPSKPSAPKIVNKAKGRVHPDHIEGIEELEWLSYEREES